MENKMIRALALNDEIRILIVDTSELVEEARKLHKMLPTSSAALGRVMSVASLMGSMLKDDKERLKIEIRGEGDIKSIFVDTYNNGNVRGLISNPQVIKVNKKTNKLDVGGAIGKGTLKVIKETEGQLPFVSQVDLQTGEIGDDFVYYFAQSEQTPSAISVGVLVNEDLSIASAGALLFQVLPAASDESVAKVEEVLANLKPISNLLKEQNIEEILLSLFEDVRIIETKDTQYQCSCNKEQMKSALATLSNKELSLLIEEDKGASLECHYCHTIYNFNESDLQEIINQ